MFYIEDKFARKGCMMIPRKMEKALLQRAKFYPAVFVTGPRQSGKTTLLKHSFPEHKFVTLEDPDLRDYATNDPRGFLNSLGEKAIIDEAQNVPEIFSYLQGMIDSSSGAGRYILSGSQNFLLMERISQTLAGRVGILNLLPFSYAEISTATALTAKTNDWIFTGSYPRIYDQNIDPRIYYSDYTSTYVERDVRTLKSIVDANTFMRFIRLCAGRIGQLVNYSKLASDAGITSATARSWLSILEASYIAYFVQPYYKSTNRRLIKAPKLYFTDTGLACYLLSIRDSSQLDLHYLRGSLFENMVMNEYIKSQYNLGAQPNLYFWRDSNNTEVDMLFEEDGKIILAEIKASETLHNRSFRALSSVAEHLAVNSDNRFVVYDGLYHLSGKSGIVFPWRDFSGKFNSGDMANALR